MTNEALIRQALAQKETDHRRAFKVEWQGAVYWLKQPGKQKPPKVIHRLQKILSRLLCLALLRPTSRVGTKEDLQVELGRIQEWQQLRLPAPVVIASGEDWFLMENAGEILPKVLPTLSSSEQERLLEKSLDTILYIHKTGTCHGRPMIKDMLLSPEGTLTLIDLEETPLDVMHLPAAQARDLVIFLSSVLDSPALPRMVERAVHASHPKTVEELRRLMGIFRFLKPLLVFIAKRKATSSIYDILRMAECLEKSLSAQK